MYLSAPIPMCKNLPAQYFTTNTCFSYCPNVRDFWLSAHSKWTLFGGEGCIEQPRPASLILGRQRFPLFTSTALTLNVRQCQRLPSCSVTNQPISQPQPLKLHFQKLYLEVGSKCVLFTIKSFWALKKLTLNALS